MAILFALIVSGGAVLLGVPIWEASVFVGAVAAVRFAIWCAEDAD